MIVRFQMAGRNPSAKGQNPGKAEPRATASGKRPSDRAIHGQMTPGLATAWAISRRLDDICFNSQAALQKSSVSRAVDFCCTYSHPHFIHIMVSFLRLLLPQTCCSSCNLDAMPGPHDLQNGHRSAVWLKEAVQQPMHAPEKMVSLTVIGKLYENSHLNRRQVSCLKRCCRVTESPGK